MASVKSPIRTIIKPILFKLLGKKFYKYAQFYGKKRDIEQRLVEEKEMILLDTLVDKGSQVLDIGANYAYFTERLSRIVGTEGRVYAFEPIPFTSEVGNMLVKHFKLKNVEWLNYGASDTNGEVEFTIPISEFGSIYAGQAHIANRSYEENQFSKFEKVSCKIVKIDDLLGSKITNLSFVKIDIEGAEYLAMRGMDTLLKKYNPNILIEINPSFLSGFGITEAEFRRYITEELGYDLYLFNAQNSKLLIDTNPFFESNYLLIHKSKKIQYVACIQ